MDHCSFLVTRATPISLALESKHIMAVASTSQWTGDEPVALEELLGCRMSIQGARRILVVQGRRGPYVLTADADIALKDCPAQELLSLPSLLWAPGMSSVVLGLCVMHASAPFLALDADAIGERWFALKNLSNQGGTP